VWDMGVVKISFVVTGSNNCYYWTPGKLRRHTSNVLIYIYMLHLNVTLSELLQLLIS
jgi:hypothetical protein